MAYFGTATAKVEKIDAPLLVVGIGGTGADGLLRIKSEFSERLQPEKLGDRELDHPPRTSYLAIDTDSTVLQKRFRGVRIDKESEWFDMSCDMGYALAPGGVHLTNDVKEWLDSVFYTDPYMREAAVKGAGTFRQLSRLMLFQKAQLIKQHLTTTLQNLAQVPIGAPIGANTINVVVITGLSGGTGSGAFLDFAYLLRHTAKEMGLRLYVELYAVAPDVTISRQAAGDPSKTLIYQTNSFAALKELDYWMNYSHRSTAHVRQEDVRIKYTDGITVAWDREPYDDVTFLCGSNAQGTALQNSYNICLNAVAQVLLFTMAGEVNKTGNDIINWENGDKSQMEDSYSFQSAKSNEHAYIRAIKHVFPQLYKYRAIGAYSNIGEQQNKISIETDLLLTDVLRYCELPDHIPTMNGNAPDLFFEPFQQKINLLWETFATENPYNPDIVSGMPPYDLNGIKSANSSSAPHGSLLEGWVKGLNGIQAQTKDRFVNEMLQTFEGMARSYIQEHGPIALQKMLDDADHGFIKMIDSKAANYETQKNGSANEYNTACQAAQESHAKLQSLSLLEFYKGPGIFRNYIAQVTNAFENKRLEIFFAIMKKALQEVANQIRSQISEGGLKYSIKAFRQLQQDMMREAQNISDDTGIPGRMQQIRQQIRGQFAAEGIQKQMRDTALQAIANAAIRFTDTAGNEDAMADLLIGRINELIDRIYSKVNDMSLQAELAILGNQGEDAIIRYTKEDIAPRLERGAQVLFAFSSAYPLSTETAVKSSYISIPAKADKVRDGVINYIKNRPDYSGAVIKNSMVDDQIFWMNIATGLPLCAYQYLTLYEDAYEQGKSRPGTHLITANEELLNRKQVERSVLNDWLLLPSPNPLKLMHDEPYPSSLLRRWEVVENLLTEAEKRNVVYLDRTSDPQEPVGGIKLFMEGNRLMTDEELAAAIGDCVVSKIKAEEQLNKLKMLLSKRMPYQIVKHETDEDHDGVPLQMEKFASKLNLHTDSEFEQAFRELVYYRMSQRPGLLIELAHQNSMVDKIDENIRSIKYQIIGRMKTERSIAEVSRMLLMDRLAVYATNIRYKNDLDEYETAGEKNILFDRDQYEYSKEAWAQAIPLLIRMIEWYSNQNHDNEPFSSLLQKTQQMYDDEVELLNNLMPGDTEGSKHAHELADKAGSIGESYGKALVKLKALQKEFPRAQYDRVVAVLNMLIKEMETIKAYFNV